MSDYISREALYNKTAEWEAQALAQVGRHMHDDDPAEWRRWSTILTERSAFKHDVCDAPAADVVEVVRCADCSVPHNRWTGCPKLGGLVTPPEFFCAFGKRKDGGDGDG